MNDTAILFVLAIPYIAVWALSVIDVLRRRDLGAAKTVAWVAALVVLPVISLLVYMYAGRGGRQRNVPTVDAINILS